MFKVHTMNSQLKGKLVSELIWLVGIVLAAAAVEYAIIFLFNLHPILNVKIQGLIGLVIIAYFIRMVARMGEEGLITSDDVNDNELEQE